MKIKLLIALWIIFVIFLPNLVMAEMEGPGIYHASSGPTYGLAIGDVTGDGLNDVVVGDGNFKISVFEQQKNGTFIETPYIAGRVVDEVALGDYNNDGLLDVAVLDKREERCVYIFYQNSSGKLDFSLTLPIVQFLPTKYRLSSPASAIVGDFNNDGLDDLAVLVGMGDGMQYLNSKVYVFYQNQTAGINTSPVIYNLNRIGFRIAKGDFNNDGLNDFVISERNSNIGYIKYGKGGFDVFLQLKSGGFNMNYYGPETGNGYADMTVSDLNNDGRDDITMISGYTIDVFVQTENGIMIKEYQVYCEGAWFLASGDVTGDKLNDIVVSTRNNGLVVFEQYNDNGIRKFIEENHYPVIYGGRKVEIGDVNNDGGSDIVVTTYNQNTITVYTQIIPFKLEVEPINSPIEEGSDFLVRWSVNKAINPQDTNVSLDGIETPGDPEFVESFSKTVTAPYGDETTVIVYAVYNGQIIYSEPQTIKLLPAIELEITKCPDKGPLLKPFMVFWNVSKYVDDTFLTISPTPEEYGMEGGHYTGMGSFKDLLKVKNLPKKGEYLLYVRAHAYVEGRHYQTEPKIIIVERPVGQSGDGIVETSLTTNASSPTPSLTEEEIAEATEQINIIYEKVDTLKEEGEKIIEESKNSQNYSHNKSEMIEVEIVSASNDGREYWGGQSYINCNDHGFRATLLVIDSSCLNWFNDFNERGLEFTKLELGKVTTKRH